MPLPKQSDAHPRFATTSWTMVVQAGDLNASGARMALEHLCRVYWYPLYAYARRAGHAPHDAQDLTQEFFARLLEGNWIAQADRERGRFRSFLLSSMKHFLANEWQRARAQKRGGGKPVLSLDDDGAEQRYQREPVDRVTPEVLFERGWALALLNDVYERLEHAYSGEGNAALFQALKPALTLGQGELNYDAIADKLGLAPTAARVAVHRMRKKYRSLIREEVASTVAGSGEVDEEMRHLFQVLSGNNA